LRVSGAASSIRPPQAHRRLRARRCRAVTTPQSARCCWQGFEPSPGRASGRINAHYGDDPGSKFYTHLSDRFAPFYTLTPLIWEHVNPYGRFELDMEARLPIN
jgi:hypothetical protein